MSILKILESLLGPSKKSKRKNINSNDNILINDEKIKSIFKKSHDNIPDKLIEKAMDGIDKSQKTLLEHLELKDWFNSLDRNIQSKIKKYYYGNLKEKLIYTDETPEGFFATLAHNALYYNRDIEFSEQFLKKLNPDKWNVLDAHFHYQTFIPLFYKLRDDESDAIEMTIDYCKRNIDLIKTKKNEILDCFQKLFDNKFRAFPEIHCFKHLCIIYASQNKIEEAIEICEEALSLGIYQDGTKYGYKGRLEKLKKKLEKSEK